MRICPTCNRSYDDSESFCQADGATLVQSDQPGAANMTMPVSPTFQPPPPPPTLATPAKPPIGLMQTLVYAFIAPARVFGSFREPMGFGPLAARVLVAATIIIFGVAAYNVIFLQRVGRESITRATIEASPRVADLPAEQKEQVVTMQNNPAFLLATFFFQFGFIVGSVVLSIPLGGAIYLLGTMIFSSRVTYPQALLVWTFATLPPKLLWALANTVALFIHRPSTDIGIVMGASNGVLPANLGVLVEVTTFPVPILAVVLGAFDLFEFYGLALAALGLRKVGRMSWVASSGVVIAVWLFAVAWRVAGAAISVALLK